jgi:hypothetical protein
MARVVLVAGVLVLLMGAAPTEEVLVRQLKVDVFDENWTAVLDDCDELLARFPGSPSRDQVAFYRAKALSRLPGREAEAIDALREFLRGHPDDRFLVEEAWSSLFAVACEPGRSGSRPCREVLGGGLDHPAPFVSTLAAIRIADVDDAALRRRALPILKKAYHSQTDADIRNEILIAILKIDPDEVPAPNGAAPPSPPRRPGNEDKPAFIRMSVFNKVEGRFEVKVQFPVAFARMLIDSLGQQRREELRREAQRQGMNIDEIFDAIRRSGRGRLLEVDTEESRIEIWIE